MSMYKNFKTNQDLEKTGIVIDYGEFRVTIARAGGANRRFAKILEGLAKPLRRAIQTETLDPSRAETIMIEAYAQGVVLNWEVLVDGKWKKGIEGPDGKILPFSPENIADAFRNLPDLFVDIQEQATKASLFRDAVRGELAGN